ncbi:hypothetical protein L6164_012106 [Bauhinia variegata]|uniref:Uncharacterized protein n=1 Tax=Bauhinia variegata TaxID=167791 RepID=A0ACB9PAG6_BAUVA|nr:hypothetical protein L6164_012106 [Bauhinia variegata]
MENVETQWLEVADYSRDPPHWLLQREPTCKTAALPASDRIAACPLISSVLGSLTFSIVMGAMVKFTWTGHFQLPIEAWDENKNKCESKQNPGAHPRETSQKDKYN